MTLEKCQGTLTAQPKSGYATFAGGSDDGDNGVIVAAMIFFLAFIFT